MPFTTTTANNIINKILRNTDFTPASTLYASLHTSDPGDSGTGEVTGGSYARLVIAFSAASGKASSNTGALSFTGMPAATITHVGLWSASSAGTFWWGGSLAVSRTTAAGDTFQIAIGDFDINLT